MRYFKITNKADPEDEFYTSASSDLIDADTLQTICHLEDYDITEVSKEEFERETDDD
jgi:hypothetical protein